VGLGAADDDPVGPPVDDVEIEVGIGLIAGPQRAVALHVGLRRRHREVLVAAALVERADPLGLVAVARQHALEREGASEPISRTSATRVAPCAVEASISAERRARSSLLRGMCQKVEYVRPFASVVTARSRCCGCVERSKSAAAWRAPAPMTSCSTTSSTCSPRYQTSRCP
jgi:hypothetical protein